MPWNPDTYRFWNSKPDFYDNKNYIDLLESNIIKIKERDILNHKEYHPIYFYLDKEYDIFIMFNTVKYNLLNNKINDNSIFKYQIYYTDIIKYELDFEKTDLIFI